MLRRWYRVMSIEIEKEEGEEKKEKRKQPPHKCSLS
jgi:hypothetical protein